ncbi:hydrogen gas-evolving membrane-bound hydrogenase subunit E [Vibrio maritimus]
MQSQSSGRGQSSSSPLFGLFALFPFLILTTVLSLYDPQGVSWSFPWVPSLGLALSFRLDGLSFLFACLISGIGTMVQIYALAYLKEHKQRLAFHCYLTAFMVAMLGVVLSDNVLLLFVFWELTTVTSYLLIGFNHEALKSRKNALQSLLITGAGGLALLAGLIMLGSMAGSYELTSILAQVNEISNHALFLPSLVLILLGALTKSAQFPFHFWLPNAMAAPTPVSAYLHSATMVKAGIYLLAVVSPIYSHSEVWFYTLTLLGGFTALWCALMALKQTDLKLMLAYSTTVVLGKLTFLLGIGSDLALKSALMLIVAHALYKAGLFMVVGNIDKAAGTREISQLRGLRSVLKISFVAAVVAVLSTSGVPPLPGFLGKEYMYKAGLEVSNWAVFLMVLVNALTVTLVMALLIKPFTTRHQGEPTQVKPVELNKGLWMPPFMLAIISVLATLIGLGWLNEQVIIPGVTTIAPVSTPEPVKMWHGINTPLILSVVTLALGVLLYKVYPSLTTLLDRQLSKMPCANRVFDNLLHAMVSFAKWQTNLLQTKRMSVYGLLSFGTLAVLLISHTPMSFSQFAGRLEGIKLYEVVIAALLIASSFVVIISRTKFLAVAALGMIGFMTTLVFMIYSAPDVAKTQLLVETLMVVFLVLLMRHVPKLSTVKQHSKGRRVLHALVAGSIGVAVTMMLISITADPIDMSVSQFFNEQSVPGGHGRNIVNVILVDFRAFDTFGEVLVVALAGLCAVSLLKPGSVPSTKVKSLILGTASHIVAALMLVFSLYLLMRGHNSPGGGFIGALIAVIGLSLLMFAESPQYVRERLHYAPFSIAMLGVFISFAAGAVSLVFNLPFLTGLWWKDLLPLGTPLIFDIGIYLGVIGGVMGMILHVTEEMD